MEMKKTQNDQNNFDKEPRERILICYLRFYYKANSDQNTAI